MAHIRKRSLKATAWIYLGFIIGAFNTYFLTHNDWFTTEQNGLTRIMIEVSMMVFAFSTFGVSTFLFKFFPYYKDNLPDKENDILGLSLVVSAVGLVLTTIGLFIMEPLIVRKFSENSPLFVEYFYWCLPMACFILLFNLLEAYSYGYHQGVTTSMLRETILRLYTLVIIVLKIFNLISFHTFIVLFAIQYAIIVIVLGGYLHYKKQLWISFKISRVTRKFRKKITAAMTLTFIVIVVNVLRSSIDGIVLAAKQSLGAVGIFGLAAYMVSVMQAPFRSLIAITIPILSRAWKDKDYKEISRIYKRSSINLLTFALFIFFCIWLNFDTAINYFNINPDYLQGKWVFVILGIVAIIETGTGVNSQIIGTSVYWRFELWTSILLTIMIIPLSYTLTVKYGIIGPAIANMVSLTIYNYIRLHFLWKKFNMQPFSTKTFEVLLIATGAYFITYYSLQPISSGLWLLIINPLVFATFYFTGIYYRNISPDVKPIVSTLRNRWQKWIEKR